MDCLKFISAILLSFQHVHFIKELEKFQNFRKIKEKLQIPIDFIHPCLEIEEMIAKNREMQYLQEIFPTLHFRTWP